MADQPDLPPELLERVAKIIAPHLEGGREFDQMPPDRVALRKWCREGMCSTNDATQDDAIEIAHAIAPMLIAHGRELEKAGVVAWRDVLAERRRQIEQEGWTPEHDDEHNRGELAAAACCYAYGEMLVDEASGAVWPWSEDWWKPSSPSDRRRDLVKAGALILAEIERLDRACVNFDTAGTTEGWRDESAYAQQRSKP